MRVIKARPHVHHCRPDRDRARRPCM